MNQRCAAAKFQQKPVEIAWHVQLPHLKVNGGHYEVAVHDNVQLPDVHVDELHLIGQCPHFS